MSIANNQQNPLVVSDRDNDNILAYRFPDLQYSPMGMFILYRMLTDRDIKGITTSKGNTTGTGKTTLTTYLCRTFNSWANQIYNREQIEWNAAEHSFMDVHQYIEKYDRAQPGEVLFTDELETMVDKRRSMSHSNVDFSHYWQEMRYKNVITWCTAPSLHNLDKRIKENTDIWINVTMQGRANVYFLTMNDFIEQWIPKRFKQNGFKMSIVWLPPQNDPDYEYLKQLKHTKDRAGKAREQEDTSNEYQEILNKSIANFIKLNDEMDLGMTQKDIADYLLGGERSQQYVSQVKREYVSNGNE